jgi:hypothetical protein
MGKFLEHYHKRSWPATFSGQATANETQSTERMMQQNNTQPTACWWCCLPTRLEFVLKCLLTRPATVTWDSTKLVTTSMINRLRRRSYYRLGILLLCYVATIEVLLGRPWWTRTKIWLGHHKIVLRSMDMAVTRKLSSCCYQNFWEIQLILPLLFQCNYYIIRYWKEGMRNYYI